MHNFPNIANFNVEIDLSSKIRIGFWRADGVSLLAFKFGSVDFVGVFVYTGGYVNIVDVLN